MIPTAREFALDVVRRLRGAGYQALWAGGCVRDFLLGEVPSDYDVATDARPDQVRALFRHTVAVGESFGVIRVLGPRNAVAVEVATFRTEGPYLDGRRPSTVAYSTPEFDASRRDFTINGMFYDPLTKQVIDFVGGQTDLTNRNLRAIGDPVARFKEDKLRLIRAARFAARFALTIDPATREALEVHAREITQVAGERIAQELRRMLCHPTRADAIRLAWNHELLTSVLPQLKPLEKDDRKDSTLHVLERLPRTADASLGFAALLHDLIEYPTSGATPDVEPRDQGRQIANLLTRQLRLSNAERDTISWIIGHRLELEHAQELRIARLKRLLSEKPCEQTRDLIEARAQVLGANRDTVLFLRNYSTTLPDGPINPPRLVSGKDLIRCLGLRPGPGFKDVLEQLYDAQLEQTVCSKEEALDWIRDWYIANPRAE